VRIQFNPRALAAYGLNIDDLRTTIGNANVNTPKGKLRRPAQASTINANDQLTERRRLPNLVVAYRNGNPVRLSDVATSSWRRRTPSSAAWAKHHAGDHPQRPAPAGRQRHQVVDAIKRCCRSSGRRCRRRSTSRVLTDRTDDDPRLGRRRRVRAGAGGRPGRAGDLPVPAQPAGDDHPEPVGAAVAGRHVRRVMYLLGFSLDNLSLMALTISTGFVVDDAIVMIENIARYVEAASADGGGAQGLEQIGFTIISLTVSLIAVLIPLLFMGDVVGRLFHEFAITLAVTIVISAVVSLTLVPMMCAQAAAAPPERNASRASTCRPSAGSTGSSRITAAR
jgi:multidrug efflux pump